MSGVRRELQSNIEIYFDGGVSSKAELDSKFILTLKDLEIADVRSMITRISRLYGDLIRNKTTAKALLREARAQKISKLAGLGKMTATKAKQKEDLINDDEGNIILSTIELLETSEEYYHYITDYLKTLFKSLETITISEGIIAKLTR